MVKRKREKKTRKRVRQRNGWGGVWDTRRQAEKSNPFKKMKNQSVPYWNNKYSKSVTMVSWMGSCDCNSAADTPPAPASKFHPVSSASTPVLYLPRREQKKWGRGRWIWQIYYFCLIDTPKTKIYIGMVVTTCIWVSYRTTWISISKSSSSSPNRPTPTQ